RHRKITPRDDPDVATSVLHKKKAGWFAPTGRFVLSAAAYWPLGTSELFWSAPVVAVPVPVVVFCCPAAGCCPVVFDAPSSVGTPLLPAGVSLLVSPPPS